MKKIIMLILTLLSCIFLILLVQRLVVPKYVTENKVGGMVRDYYKNNSENDVVFIGDCEVYASFVPVYMWGKYGLTSYIRGSANQTIWQSYYMLLDTLKYEKPRVVVFNVLSMKYDEPVKEEYNRLTLDGMRFGKNKILSIKASMTGSESLVSYIFPIIRYHERIWELTGEDIKYYFDTPEVTSMGYLPDMNVKPVGALPVKTELADYAFNEKCYEYLEKIVKVCKDNEIKLILIKAPTLYPYWYEEWDLAISEFAKREDICYINFAKKAPTLLDYSHDTSDGGFHLNYYGAVKLSDYFGEYITKELGIVPMTKSEETIHRWEKASYKLKKEIEQ